MSENQKQEQEQTKEEGLFLNSIPSPYTRKAYKLYLDKYLQTVGYKNINGLLSQSPRKIEEDIIEFIISLKETGCKFSTIANYTYPVIALCKINDIVLNTTKIKRFVPPRGKNRKTRQYYVPEIQKLLDVSDERMRCAILTLSSIGCRIGGLVRLVVGNLKSVNNDSMYQVTVYENEPEEYITFCTSECRSKGIDPYLDMRRRYGEEITDTSPLIREEFDRRDPFAAAHAKPIKEMTIQSRLTNMAEAAGLRTRTALEKGQKSASQKKEVPCTNGMRRHFSTTLVNSKVPSEHRFLMEGHNLKFNDMSYVHVSNDDLLQSYLLAHDNLIIDQTHKLKEKIAKLEIEKSKIDELVLEMQEIKKAMNKNHTS